MQSVKHVSLVASSGRCRELQQQHYKQKMISFTISQKDSWKEPFIIHRILDTSFSIYVELRAKFIFLDVQQFINCN